jgi:hypothetical protein
MPGPEEWARPAPRSPAGLRPRPSGRRRRRLPRAGAGGGRGAGGARVAHAALLPVAAGDCPRPRRDRAPAQDPDPLPPDQHRSGGLLARAVALSFSRALAISASLSLAPSQTHKHTLLALKHARTPVKARSHGSILLPAQPPGWSFMLARCPRRWRRAPTCATTSAPSSA